MQELMIKALMSVILKSLSEDSLKEMADKLIDFVEEKVNASENKIDDVLVLPVLKQIRQAFSIND
jgi:hypothetical protein